MRNLLIIFAVPAVLGLGWLGGRWAAQDRPTPRQERSESSATIWREVETIRRDVEERLVTLESRDGFEFLMRSIDELRGRLRRLEDSAAGTKPTESSTQETTELPLSATKEQLAAALRRLSAPVTAANDPRWPNRIAILERLLKEHPSDESAPFTMARLVTELLKRPGQAERAYAAIQALGAKIGLPEWRAEWLRGHVALYDGDRRKQREHYERVLTSVALTEPFRATVMFSHAYSFIDDQEYETALQNFERIVERYKALDDPQVRNTVKGARNQIALLEQAIKKRDRRN